MILPVTPVESMSRLKVPVRKPVSEVRVVMPKPKPQAVDVGFYYCPYVPESFVVDYDVNALNLAYSVPLIKGLQVDEQASKLTALS